MSVRVSLTDRISIEGSGGDVDEQQFPGRQGRFVFAYLVDSGGRPVPREELADALWEGEPPAKWDKALSVLVSKLRVLLTGSGVDGAAALTSAFGCYQLRLPPDSWIDVAAAEDAVRAAERFLAAGDTARAADNASAGASLARRTFLPGDDGRWVDDRRRALHDVLVRGLECLAEASVVHDPRAAVRAGDELVGLEPFRERGYRLLMQAHAAAGNEAEALRTYERCRSLLADEIGTYPSSETEAVYLELLRTPRASAGVVSSLLDGRRRRSRQALAALVTAAVIIVGGIAAAFAFTRGAGGAPEIVPNSLVRLDPRTFEPTQVLPVETGPDFAVASGGYVWVTHNILRRTDPGGGLRNAGDRTLTRVDPVTGDVKTLSGGLAPCGIAPDPSGDVWVANCFSNREANVVRVAAATREFRQTIPVRGGVGFFRGLAYGGGWLWVADLSGGADYHGITRINPQTDARRRIPLDRHATYLAWSGGYGDLWTNDFDRGSVARLHADGRMIDIFERVTPTPAVVAVDGDTVWVGDWNLPRVVRLHAVGAPRKLTIPLPGAHGDARGSAGVTIVAVGGGAVWAAIPEEHAIWRIDPKTNEAIRVPVPYFPMGVAATEDAVWVTVRGA